MCYIDLQHYIQCKHTDAQFRSCWNPTTQRTSLESGDHNVFRAELHSYDRLCGECYADAVNRRYGRSADMPVHECFAALLTYLSAMEIVEGNQKAGELGPFGVNEDHGGKIVACMFEGGIDRETALRERRHAFRNRPTHVANMVPPSVFEPAFITAGNAYDVDYIHDVCEPTTNVKEILLYFSECKHFNGVWCEELLEGNGGFMTRCGCDRYDEKLAKNPYAECAGLCLRCRGRRVDDWSFLTDMVRDISGDRELALWPFSQRQPYREVR